MTRSELILSPALMTPRPPQERGWTMDVMAIGSRDLFQIKGNNHLLISWITVLGTEKMVAWYQNRESPSVLAIRAPPPMVSECCFQASRCECNVFSKPSHSGKIPLPTWQPNMIKKVLDHCRVMGKSVLSIQEPKRRPLDFAILSLAADAHSKRANRVNNAQRMASDDTRQLVSSAYCCNLMTVPRAVEIHLFQGLTWLLEPLFLLPTCKAVGKVGIPDEHHERWKKVRPKCHSLDTWINKSV